MTRTLTIRGIPDRALERLRARAAANRRSLNGELLVILQLAADGAWPEESRNAAPADHAVRELAATPYAASSARHDLLSIVDRDELAAVCRHYHIAWLAVFGSYARGDAHAHSDVDVVVEFAPGRTPGFGIVRVADALRPVFGGRRVDVLTRSGLSPRLRERVLSSAITLHVAE